MPAHLCPHDAGRVATHLAGLAHANFEAGPVQCSECGARCKTAKGLAYHLKKHGCPPELLRPLAALRTANDQSRRAAEPVHYPSEFTYFKPDLAGNSRRVHCNKCMKAISKGQVQKHVTISSCYKGCHLPATQISTWKSIRDGWAIGHNKSEQATTTFEAAYVVEHPSHAPGIADQGPSDATLPGAIHAQTQAIVCAINATRHIGQPTPPAGSSSTVPCRGTHTTYAGGDGITVGIKQEASEFKKFKRRDLEKITSRRNYKWPCGRADDIDFTQLEAHIQQTSDVDDGSDDDGDGTLTHIMLYIKYFFAAFTFSDSTRPLHDLYMAAHSQGRVREIFLLDLLSPAISWTAKMKEHLEYLVDYLTTIAEDINEKDIAFSAITLRRQLNQLEKKIPRQLKWKHDRRKSIDLARSKRIAPVATQLVAANWAYIDLDILCSENLAVVRMSGSIPSNVRRAIYWCIAGMYTALAFMGRPGDFECMKLSTVETFVANAAAWYILVDNEKTKETHGKLGRYIRKQLKETMAKLLPYGCKERDLLLPPPCGGEKISLNKAIHGFTAWRMHGWQPQEPKLNQKAIETSIGLPENRDKANAMSDLIGEAAQKQLDVLRKAARMSGHLDSTQKKHYLLESGDAEQDARTSWAYQECFVGDLPPYTAEQVEARRTRTTQDILDEIDAVCKREATAKRQQESCNGGVKDEGGGAECDGSDHSAEVPEEEAGGAADPADQEYAHPNVECCVDAGVAGDANCRAVKEEQQSHRIGGVARSGPAQIEQELINVRDKASDYNEDVHACYNASLHMIGTCESQLAEPVQKKQRTCTIHGALLLQCASGSDDDIDADGDRHMENAFIRAALDESIKQEALVEASSTGHASEPSSASACNPYATTPEAPSTPTLDHSAESCCDSSYKVRDHIMTNGGLPMTPASPLSQAARIAMTTDETGHDNSVFPISRNGYSDRTPVPPRPDVAAMAHDGCDRITMRDAVEKCMTGGKDMTPTSVRSDLTAIVEARCDQPDLTQANINEFLNNGAASGTGGDSTAGQSSSKPCVPTRTTPTAFFDKLRFTSFKDAARVWVAMHGSNVRCGTEVLKTGRSHRRMTAEDQLKVLDARAMYEASIPNLRTRPVIRVEYATGLATTLQFPGGGVSGGAIRGVLNRFRDWHAQQEAEAEDVE